MYLCAEIAEIGTQWMNIEFSEKLDLKIKAQGCIEEDPISKKKSINEQCIKKRVDEIMFKMVLRKEEIEKQQERKAHQKI